MSSVSQLVVKISGDSKALGTLNKDVDGVVSKLESRLDKFGKAATVGVTLPLAAIGTMALKSFAEAEKVAAQTEAAIKATGGAANVTAGHVKDMAARLQDLTGMSDESVAGVSNLLLSFKAIKNQGPGVNAIFDRATETALDMSVALGVDAKTSAMQLAKALEDPERGITALRKAGTTFTDDQEKMIKTLTESGDVLGAQKMILDEIAKQYGGSAAKFGETTAGQIEKAKNAVDDAMEDMGAAIAPTVSKMAGSLGDLAKKFQDLPPEVQQTVVGVGAFAAAVGPASMILSKMIGFAKGAGSALTFLGGGVGESATKMEKFGTAAKGAGRAVGGLSIALGAKNVADAKDSADKLAGSYQAVGGALMMVGGPVGMAAGGAMIGLGTAMNWALGPSKQLEASLDAVANGGWVAGLKGEGLAAAQAFRTAGIDPASMSVGQLSGQVDFLSQQLAANTSGLALSQLAYNTLTQLGFNPATMSAEELRAKTAELGLQAPMTADQVRQLGGAVSTLAAEHTKAAEETAKAARRTAEEWENSWKRSIPMIGGIISEINKLNSASADADKRSAGLEERNQRLKDAIARGASAEERKNIREGRAAHGGLVPRHYATGGAVYLASGGPKGTDTVPAWLTPGEFVMQKSAVERYGTGFMESVNSGQLAAAAGDGLDQSTAEADKKVDPLAQKVAKTFDAVPETWTTAWALNNATLATQLQATDRTWHLGADPMARAANDAFNPLAPSWQTAMYNAGNVVAAGWQRINREFQSPWISTKSGVLNPMMGGLESVAGVMGLGWSLPRFHSGGKVPGTGEVPATLLSGEYVLNRDATGRLGQRYLDAVNKGMTPPDFHGGGLVGGASAAGRRAGAAAPWPNSDWQDWPEQFRGLGMRTHAWAGSTAGAIGGGLGHQTGEAAAQWAEAAKAIAEELGIGAMGGISTSYDSRYSSQEQWRRITDYLDKQGVGYTVSSGYRSPEHNAAIGGAPGSLHTLGRAADLVPPSDAIWGALEPQAKKGKLAQLLNLSRSPNYNPGPVGPMDKSDHIHAAVFGKGGIATSATQGTFGETGPEALIPLNSPAADRYLGRTVNVEVNVGNLVGGNSSEIAVMLRDMLVREIGKREGSIFGAYA